MRFEVGIRPETVDDYDAVRRVHTSAFGGPAEANLVDALRRTDAYIPSLSRVAVLNGDVIGHVLYSRAGIEADGTHRDALALAPLAVLPTHQRSGVGTLLMRESLQACKQEGHRIVIVLGHPEYYRRFGFRPAHLFGIRAPFPLSKPDVLMALGLTPGALDEAKGLVRYARPFYDLP